MGLSPIIADLLMKELGNEALRRFGTELLYIPFYYIYG